MTKSVIPKKRLLLWSAVLCAVTLAIMIATLAYPKNAPFVPPPFEPNAVQGDPDPPESFAYSSLWQTGMNFTSGLCQLPPLNLTEQGIEMTLHFTNPSENRVWMKARILDANGDVLGETGLLRPGEYVPTVILSHYPVSETLTVKIMTYEPETYYSNGSVTAVVKPVIMGDVTDNSQPSD